MSFFFSHIVFFSVALVFFVPFFQFFMPSLMCVCQFFGGISRKFRPEKPPVPGKMTLIFSVQNFGQIVNCIFCSSIAAARVGRKVASLKGFKSFS